MKKYITVAALLAAGTAYANADVVLIDSPMTAGDVWTIVNRGGKNEGSWSEEGRVSGDWTRVSLYSVLGTGINLDADALYHISYDVTTTNADVVAILELANSDFTLALGGSYNSNKEFAVGTVDKNALTEASTFYMFQDSGKNTTKFPMASTLQSDFWTAGDYSISVTLQTSSTGEDLINVSALKGGEAVSVEKSYSFTGTGILDYAGFALDGDAGAVTVSNFKITAVPEPSAFGMLAGLGALALVASRRRRK